MKTKFNSRKFSILLMHQGTKILPWIAFKATVSKFFKKLLNGMSFAEDYVQFPVLQQKNDGICKKQ